MTFKNHFAARQHKGRVTAWIFCSRIMTLNTTASAKSKDKMPAGLSADLIQEAGPAGQFPAATPGHALSLEKRLVPEFFGVFINYFGKVLDEFIHPVALGLQEIFGNVGGSGVYLFELMVIQPTDFLCIFL
jgi:hypothetical protein